MKGDIPKPTKTYLLKKKILIMLSHGSKTSQNDEVLMM